ncbi:MAG: amidase [Aquihabitans sp.]
MTDQPWTGDACSLVDAFRSGERSPIEELDATLGAITSSRLNAFSHVDPERARTAAKAADVSLPFGGVPFAIKELDEVAGWPDTGASLVFKDRVATHTSRVIERVLDEGGAVPVGLTTASEFGGLNVSITKLNGVTHNPWEHGRTVGGSSSGSAAAVAGGLVSLASGGDGGGSIRIPAGYTGLLGMKGTYGRISRGPRAYFRPGTVVLGNLSRSVRDAARYFDVAAGTDLRDPTSLPSHGQWEAGLGTHDLTGKKVAIVPSLGGTMLDDGVEEHLRASAEALIAATGMVQVHVPLVTPNLAAMWMMGNLSTLVAELGDRWPGCAPDLTDEVAFGVYIAQAMYNLHSASIAEAQRLDLHEAMATAFEQADFVIAATNPGPAFAADATTSNPSPLLDNVMGNVLGRLGLRGVMKTLGMTSGVAPRLPGKLVAEVERRMPELVSMGGLTIASNVYGNPAVSIPAGVINGLPVGMQVLAPHHHDALLFDVALAVERHNPWPLVAPSVTG